MRVSYAMDVATPGRLRFHLLVLVDLVEACCTSLRASRPYLPAGSSSLARELKYQEETEFTLGIIDLDLPEQ